MNKVFGLDVAMEHVEDGVSLMVGGFLGVGTPYTLLDAVYEKGCRNLTIIANDTDFSGKGLGKLVSAGRVVRAIVSHIGTNPETGKRMNAGEMEVDLVPQGTMAERMRCAGAGLGGVLTATGIGTLVAEGKQVIASDGKEYLLEKPLSGDVALIKAHISDTSGNLVFRGTARNFNPLMAMAGKKVIVQATHIVETGEIEPNAVMIPGVFVDYVVQSRDN